MEILYEDNHLLAINKPAGLLTQPSGTQQANLEDMAKDWIKTTYHKPGHVFLHAIHRLDRPASGVVLFARTSKALSRLNESMRAKYTRKRYLAIVCSVPTTPQQILENYIIHGDHCAELASPGTARASLARLSYTLKTAKDSLAMLEIELETGRYHQIRLQLSAIGCPILGDRRYGGRQWGFTDQIALHHHQLIIPHPITKEPLELKAACPPHWPLKP